MRPGIIPARAGFTYGRSSPLEADGDHPRSRGVYPAGRRGRPRFRGSSPLARGLRHEPDEQPEIVRIIPARAGFTRAGAHPPGEGRDHPRSRGVYFTDQTEPSQNLGSSPLARGLRGLHSPHHRGRRIIPARAGFTVPGRQRGPQARDHPRSRGVYPRPDPRERIREGSSPLARGLRYRPCGSGPGDRIIPARAGFTISVDLDGVCAEDHPRSRGVYSVRAGRGRTWVGSSPLARGLQGRLHRELVDARIIPARAGFTPRTPSGVSASTDHPRSRGVYSHFP